MNGISGAGGAARFERAEPDAAGEALHAPEAAPSPSFSSAPKAALPARRPVITAAPPPEPATVRSMDDVKEIVHELIAESYPELAKAHFDFRAFDSDAYYFQSNVKPLSAVVGPHRYVIEANPRAFDLGVPREAVKAILAHELAHTVHYEEKGLGGILGTGIAQLVKPLGIPLERRTDLEAISRGYGDGLIQYREWVYAHIPSADVADKRALYFSPEEIRAIQAGAKEFPDLMAQWKKHPPRDLAGIERDIAARRRQ